MARSLDQARQELGAYAQSRYGTRQGFRPLTDADFNELGTALQYQGGDIDDPLFARAQQWIDTRYDSPYGDDTRGREVPGEGPRGGQPDPRLRFNVPDAPGLRLSRLQRPAPFTYRAFTAPRGEDVLNDPAYKFRRDQALGALQSSAAARGALRDPNTRYRMTELADQMASQEYRNLYDRQLNEWRQGHDAAAQAYDRNWGAQLAEAGFNRAGEMAEYDPLFQTWQTRTGADVRGDELSFDRQWQQHLYGSDDAYRRERDRWLRDQWNQQFQEGNRRYNRDDWWRGQDFDEARRRFLAGLR